MRLLVLAPDAPFPPVTGGQLRIHHLLRALAARHDVTLIGFNWGISSAAAPFPARVIEVPWEMPRLHEEMIYGEKPVAQAAFEQLATETEEPFLVSYYASPAMEETLRKVTQEPFDRIIIENTFMARFLPVLPARVPKVLVLHNVLSLIAQRQAEGASGEEKVRADADRTLRFEKWAASQCDLCIAVSDPEAEAAKALLECNRVEVVPNGVDTSFFTPSEEQPRGDFILFTGSMNYWPNSEAVQHFTKEIWPLILRSVPAATFHIVGTNPGKEVTKLARDRVIVHGAVADMRPYFRDASVVVVPLLSGGGTRLKILEAGASGKAIVSTSVGAEGLEFLPDRDLSVADSAEEFAEAVVRLCGDEKRREELGWGARQASLKYDWRRLGELLCHIIADKLAPAG